MGKTVVLNVRGGGDYGANYFRENYKAQEVYEEMVRTGVTEMGVPDEYEGDLIECKIYEFQHVDPEFVNFLFNELYLDDDVLKQSEFIFVEAVI